MGTITTGTGLISGLNTSQIVDALINAQKGTVNLLTARVKDLQTTQTGLATLSANLLSLSTSASDLKGVKTFLQRTVANSDTDQLAVTAGSAAALGTYQLQVLRKASAQQTVSKGFANVDQQTVGAGTLTLSNGGGLTTPTRLDFFNGGAGVQRGQFRITDRSGATATINIGGAVSVDDVVNAINNNSNISVTARVDGNRLVIDDNTGLSASNLIVSNVSGSHVASDLGISQSVAGDTLTGSDVYHVTGDFKLSQINDGNAPRLITGTPSFRIALTDVAATKLDVNLDGAATVDDVINRINNHADNTGKVLASLSNGWIVLQDLTAGGGASPLAVTDLNNNSVVQQLGLDGAASGATLTGKKLLAGMDSVLLRNLRGGQGFDQLGSIELTDRTGTTATIDLSTAESLDEVLTAINGATSSGAVKLQLTASLNATGNGIQIVDTSSSTASNLKIADVGGSTLATQLGIAVDAAQTSVNSGSLNLRYVNEATDITKFAAKGTVDQKSFSISDSNGGTYVVNISSTVKTVGDVLQRINAVTGSAVTAKLNDTGDGIELVDNAGGGNQLSVVELGGTTAADLHLLGTGATGTDGKSHLSGRSATVITIDSTDTLSSLATKINAAGGKVVASTFDDGTGINSARLVLQTKTTGLSGAVIVDSGSLNLGFTTQVAAQDAVVQVGATAENSFLHSSSTNHFDNILPGISVDALKVGTTAADVALTQDTSRIAKAISSFVTAYNALLTSTDTLTKFDLAGGSRGPLQGDATVVRVLSRFQGIVNGRIGTSSSAVRSLFDLGVSAGDGGKLSFDQDQFNSVVSDNPTAVQDFFTTATTGFGVQLSTAVETYTDKTTGVFTVQTKAVQDSIDSMNNRIADMNSILDVRKQRLTDRFSKMEEILSNLQTQQTAITQFQAQQAKANS